MLWASDNDWNREWIQQVVALLVGHTAFTLYPALSQCDNAAERLTRWLTYQLPRVKKAHPSCPIHQWLNSIGAQEIVEKWQHPEQWPNLYWLPSSPEQMGKSCTELLLRGFRKESQKRNGNVISHQINLALLHHLCGPENDVWLKANFGAVTDYGTKN